MQTFSPTCFSRLDGLTAGLTRSCLRRRFNYLGANESGRVSFSMTLARARLIRRLPGGFGFVHEPSLQPKFSILDDFLTACYDQKRFLSFAAFIIVAFLVSLNSIKMHFHSFALTHSRARFNFTAKYAQKLSALTRISI